ncbi:MAG TPA: peptidylprolyl isomerase [Candidatus Anaerofilum faecale]|nr:peptidylprolyl isomerase [Anaerofilum sp. An201]OUP02485.1 peptidyl-prolyl cis-trans isomerase [Anaerofilum sp. An201]HIX13451.1 peptidylprolyl isomerase [Candidatus Anaerofilum faecale]
MKRLLSLCAAAAVTLGLLAGCSSAPTPQPDGEDLLSGTHHAEIVVKDYGTIKVELDADTAPITVTNFVNLAKDGFYDGLTFHRIISGFMIQGGDPNGDGTGGSEETIKGEFSENGVENDISHERGVISMARAQDMDSASSQFFIMHADADYLDGNYAAFGHVTEGMEVVDAICDSTPVTDNNGTVAKENQPVIESITIID